MKNFTFWAIFQAKFSQGNVSFTPPPTLILGKNEVKTGSKMTKIPLYWLKTWFVAFQTRLISHLRIYVSFQVHKTFIIPPQKSILHAVCSVIEPEEWAHDWVWGAAPSHLRIWKYSKTPNFEVLLFLIFKLVDKLGGLSNVLKVIFRTSKHFSGSIYKSSSHLLKPISAGAVFPVPPHTDFGEQIW